MPQISDNFQIGPDGAYEHDFQTKPGFIEKRMEQMLEITAREEYNKQIGNKDSEAEAFFHYTDKDIWIAGFKAGLIYKETNMYNPNI